MKYLIGINSTGKDSVTEIPILKIHPVRRSIDTGSMWVIK